MSADDRLIVGLDVPTIEKARQVVEDLGDSVSFYKIGHQLCYAPISAENNWQNGFHLARELIDAGKKVFLDLKLLDIDNTVASGVASVVQMGVSMLTIHAYPKAMGAAVKAAEGSAVTLLGVTVLTSMDDQDLLDAGYADTAQSLVTRRADQARDAGMGGVVASALEASKIREIVGPEMAVVTPGIRPAGADAGDQKRVMTPSQALRAGASHLVIARPIIAAADPRDAALSILSEMQNS